MRIARTFMPFLLAACAGTDGPGNESRADWTTTIDTIGDTTVVRTAGGSDAASRHTLTPEVAIGASVGADEYILGDISEVEATVGGDIYLFDLQVPALRLYDTAARHVRTLGSKGDGPGEYEAANGLAVHRDGRVVLWDAGKASINVYSPAGESVGSWPIPEAGGFRSSNDVFADTRGNTYVRMRLLTVSPGPPEARLFGNTVLFKWDPAGRLVDTLALPASSVAPSYLTASHEGSTSRTTVPFSPTFIWTFSPMGYFVSARTDRYEIHVTHGDGKVTRVARDIEPIPVDPEERNYMESMITARMREVDPTWRWPAAPIPPTKPPLQSLAVGEDGRLWVTINERAVRLPDGELPPLTDEQKANPQRAPRMVWRETALYDVFEPDGRFIGRVAPPPRTTLRAMRGNHVWGITRDSLDVQQVVRFRVTPGFGGK